MSAAQARAKHVASVWDGLEVEAQWLLLFGFDRGDVEQSPLLELIAARLVEASGLVADVMTTRLTELGREVEAHGRAAYEAA